MSTHLESSAKSLNHHSWNASSSNGGGEKRSSSRKDTTPLLEKRRSYSAPGQGGGSDAASAAGSDGKETLPLSGKYSSASYSAVPGEAEGRGLYLKHSSFFGEVRSCRRFSCLEWTFFIIALATMAGILGMSIERFVLIHRTFGNETAGNESSGSIASDKVDCSHWSCLNDFTFGVLILVNWLFCLYYCCDGLLRERPFEIIGYAFTIFIIFVYVVVNYFVEGEQGDIAKLIRMILSFILGPMNIVLSVVVQYHMGFLVVYPTKLTRVYHTRRLYLTVQTFNIQILTNILVLSWVKAGHFSSLGEKIILPILIVYMIAISYLGWIAVQWEIRPLALTWNLLSILSFGYYIFKIVNIGVHWSHYRQVYIENYTNGEPAETHFLYIAVAILFACLLGMLVAGLMAGLMFFAMGNFGKGLKDAMPPPFSWPCSELVKKDLVSEHLYS